MPKYEFAIAVRDEADLTSGHRRKKEGDIVCVTEHRPHHGRKTLAPYLWITIKLEEENLNTVRQKFMESHYVDGHVEGETFREIEGDDQHVLDLRTNQPIPKPKRLGKNRYSVPLDTLKMFVPELDLAKVRNIKYIYQPMKIASQLVEGKKDLTVGNVDCGLDPTTEQSIKWTLENLVKDNHTKNFIGSI